MEWSYLYNENSYISVSDDILILRAPLGGEYVCLSVSQVIIGLGNGLAAKKCQANA